MPTANRDPNILRLGARGSLLSREQSSQVARAMEASHPGLRVELVIVTTSGDRIQDRPLHEFGGKGLFTKELELALLRGEIDFAVHSYKDVPVTMPLVDTAELVIAAVPVREDVRDVLVSNVAKTLHDLPQGARVGTSSLRRQAQVLACRPDVMVLPLRGNVDTRIRKVRDGEYDAIILAHAGLTRAGLFDSSLMTPLESHIMMPAAGQGALALQCRTDQATTRAILESLNDPVTARTVQIEREVVRLLDGDCHSPIAAQAVALPSLAGQETVAYRLSARVSGRDGRASGVSATATSDDATELAAIVVEKLKSQGALKLLHP